MNFFKKVINEAEAISNAINGCQANYTPPKPEEEWVWVEGYKGTDKDMRCIDFQYELGIQYDIPEDQEIVDCKNGFHLCLRFSDVFAYYNVGCGNRFFKVKALVRKSDKDRYGSYEKYTDHWGHTINGYRYDKLASKSIIFQSELTIDEILKNTDVKDLPEQYKKMAIETNVQCAIDSYRTDTLISDGYSQPFACHIIKQKLFDIAHAVGSQKDLSMDMKVLAILYNKKVS